jgi:hypothetical protein
MTASSPEPRLRDIVDAIGYIRQDLDKVTPESFAGGRQKRWQIERGRKARRSDCPTISPPPGCYSVGGGRRRFGRSANVISWYDPGIAASMARTTGSGSSRMTGQAFVERTTRAM